MADTAYKDLFAVGGGLSTTRLPASDNSEKEARARVALSAIACEIFGVPIPEGPDPEPAGTPEEELAKRWRDEMYAALGLTQRRTPAATPAAPAANPTGAPRLVATIRYQDDNDWRHYAACRDADPELFYPVGHGSVADPQIEAAKQWCRHCPVATQCLQYALTVGDDHAVLGGTSPDERRAYRNTHREAA